MATIAATNGTLVAERHRFANVGAEFQLVLDELRRERRAVGELAHVLGAIDDGQMPARVDQARIAGLEPAVRRDGVARRLVLLVVAQEHAGALHLHFAALADAHFGAGQRAADGIGIGLVVVLQADQGAGLGGPVDLLQVDAERAEEAERVRPQRRSAAQAPARIAQAQLVAHGAVNEHLAEPAGDPGAERNGLAVAPQQLAPLGSSAENTRRRAA